MEKQFKKIAKQLEKLGVEICIHQERKNCLLVSAESHNKNSDFCHFDYYNEFGFHTEMGQTKELYSLLSENGFYAEFVNAGVASIYKA